MVHRLRKIVLGFFDLLSDSQHSLFFLEQPLLEFLLKLYLLGLIVKMGFVFQKVPMAEQIFGMILLVVINRLVVLLF